MDRRGFLQHSSLATAAAIASSTVVAEESATTKPSGNFKLKYAPHFGMFEQHAGPDLTAQLRFAREQGFTAWEDNWMARRPPEEQEKLGATMKELGMTMGVFVAHGSFGQITFAGRDEAAREQVLKNIKESVEVAKRVQAKWMTVVPDLYDQRMEWGYQTANCVDLLRRCCEIFEPHGLVMVLEPLNWWRDHPGLFLHKIPQAYEICRAVDSPACKILFDLYHQQIAEGNLIPNIDLAWDEVAYFQCGDNPGRNEPGTGEINYRNVFAHLRAKGYQGVIGMEHGNSQQGKDGEAKVIQAYREVDPF